MATTGEADCSLASKCMGFCQALASQGLPFHFTLNMGSTFTFSLDTRGKAKAGPVAKKKSSPSTQRRNARRREEFLSKKRQSLSTVNPPVDKATASLLSCDQCDYKNVSEKGLRQHTRMKHKKAQLDDQLPKSSPPATPESLRQSAELSRLSSSPLMHKSREEICPNCDGVLNSDHQCDDESDSEEDDDEEIHSCDQCGKTFANDCELSEHTATQHKHRCYFSPLCGKKFIEHSEKIEHETDVHNNRCDRCHKQYCNGTCKSFNP